MRPVLSILLAGILLFGASESAGGEDDTDTEIARRYFAAGQGAYVAGNYELALDRFRAAQRVKPLPAFEYNIGRCHDRLDRPLEAIAAYERYLALEPKASNADELLGRVRQLRERSAPADGHPRNSGTARRYLVPGVLLAGTLAVTAVAAGLVGSVAPQLATVERAWDLGGRTDALVAEGIALERRALAGYALFGVAGALAVVDAVLWARAARKSRSAELRVSAVPQKALTVCF